MDHKYQRVPHGNEPSDSQQSGGIFLSTKIFVLFLCLSITNLLLAAANTHYSLTLTQELRRYEEKDLSSLPRVDPINGGYISKDPDDSSGFAKLLERHMVRFNSFGGYHVTTGPSRYQQFDFALLNGTLAFF
ncbi:hypothetical protein GALMADRAFT_206128 [Galerina marginata CBS 339.88]|uniref:Uncharacterized protein n=1 Tax=Galerina marginata (strain CBS 339.88) TaxID=685588 RepID=A0A067TZR9_GALM3|nr:hypothetical protein GALMADRAFT_206128 [Galerina marginata CBS 339.88]